MGAQNIFLGPLHVREKRLWSNHYKTPLFFASQALKMSTIHCLSEELLRLVFKELDKRALVNCTHVCKAWYSPAMSILLQEVDFRTQSEVDSFIAFIDNNSAPWYTNAVKEIYLRRPVYYKELFYLDSTYSSKLFSRFPNLETIYIGQSVSLKNLNDDICKTIAKHCPKLTRFVIDPSIETQCDIPNVRLLVTHVLYYNTTRQTTSDIVAFFKSFPRLVSNDGFSPRCLDSFEQVMCILEELSYFTDVCMGSVEEREEGFAEKYLATKPKEDQGLIMDRLAKVESLEVDWKGGFCVNSAKFILKYMTALKSIVFSDILCNNRAVDELVKIIDSSADVKVKFSPMNFEELSNCFGKIATQLLAKNCSQYKKRKRTLTIESSEEDYDYLSIKGDDNDIKLKVGVIDVVSLNEISSSLFSQVFDVDEFNLDGLYDRLDGNIDLYWHDAFIKSVPSSETLTLPVDNGEGEELTTEISLENENLILPSVKYVKLLISFTDQDIRPFLKRYAIMFPSIRSLTFDNWCGVYDDEKGEHYINLYEYSLKNLKINLNFIYEVLPFFIIQLEILST